MTLAHYWFISFQSSTCYWVTKNSTLYAKQNMYLLRNSKALSFMLVKSTDKNDKKKKGRKRKKTILILFQMTLWANAEVSANQKTLNSKCSNQKSFGCLLLDQTRRGCTWEQTTQEEPILCSFRCWYIHRYRPSRAGPEAATKTTRGLQNLSYKERLREICVIQPGEGSRETL